jgi:hypothetical protein
MLKRNRERQSGNIHVIESERREVGNSVIKRRIIEFCYKKIEWREKGIKKNHRVC